FPKPSISVTGALPAGVMFTDNGNGTGTLAGTPGPNTAGMYPLMITVSNTLGMSPAQMFALNVVCPAIGLAPPGMALAAAESMTAYGRVTCTPSNGHGRYTLVPAGQPAGLGFTGNDLGGTPTATGMFMFTVKAVDGFGCESPTNMYSLTIKPKASADS